MIVEAMEKILANPKVDHDVEHVLEKTCRGVPIQYRTKVIVFNNQMHIALYIFAQTLVHGFVFYVLFTSYNLLV